MLLSHCIKPKTFLKFSFTLIDSIISTLPFAIFNFLCFSSIINADFNIGHYLHCGQHWKQTTMGFLHQGNLSEVQFGVVKEGRKRPQWKDQYSVQVRLCEISWTTTNTQTWPAIDKWQWGFYFGQVYCLSTDVWTAGVLIESPLICGKFYNLVFSCPDPSASNAMSESVFSLWHRVYLKNYTPPCPCSDISALYFVGWRFLKDEYIGLYIGHRDLFLKGWWKHQRKCTLIWWRGHLDPCSLSARTALRAQTWVVRWSPFQAWL